MSKCNELTEFENKLYEKGMLPLPLTPMRLLGIVNTLVLSEFILEDKYAAEKKNHNEDGYFASNMEVILYNTGLKEEVIYNAAANLCEREFIDIKAENDEYSLVKVNGDKIINFIKTYENSKHLQYRFGWKSKLCRVQKMPFKTNENPKNTEKEGIKNDYQI